MAKTKKVPDSPRGGTLTVEELYGLVAPEIPCEYVTGTFPDTKPCTHEAQWIMHVDPHCTKVQPSQRLLCNDCLERIKSGDVWQCLRCHAYARVIEYVTSIERI